LPPEITAALTTMAAAQIQPVPLPTDALDWTPRTCEGGLISRRFVTVL